MIHNLNNIPGYKLPDGYQIHYLNGHDDILQWAKVLTAADEFDHETNAVQRFRTEFQPYLHEAKNRMIFLTAPDGTYAGTATAWFDSYHNETIGRLHWVAIHPDHQGKGLAKPLITSAMDRLAHSHHKAYLSTQPRNLTAIRLYFQLGFQPAVQNAEDQSAWEAVYSQLHDM